MRLCKYRFRGGEKIWVEPISLVSNISNSVVSTLVPITNIGCSLSSNLVHILELCDQTLSNPSRSTRLLGHIFSVIV